VTPNDAALLETWQSSEFNELGPPDEELLAARVPSFRLLVVRNDDEPVGYVTWRRVRYGPNRESRAWNIGVSIIPSARGQGYGTEAQRLLAVHLFATTDVNRVEAATDVANLAEQRALEKAGFTREGILRGAQFRAGSWHDLVYFSLLRKETLRPGP
jgi:RimJ/RimL family protein N-acetyltransferase